MLRTLLGWLGRWVHGFHTVLGVVLSVGLLLAAGALWLFASLADEVFEGGTRHFDDAVLLWLNARATPMLDVLAREITSLGSFVVVGLVCSVAAAFLWLTRHRYSVAVLAASAVGAAVLNLVLKGAFHRPRPQLFPWRVPYAGQSSFPSGHAMTSMAVYATLAYLIARLQPTHALRWVVFVFTGVLVLLIGLSRLYLGVHYPSDVLAGYTVGFAWAAVCAAAIEAVQYFQERRPGVERVEHPAAATPVGRG